MATILYDPDRKTIPRWRFWKDAVQLGDVDSTHEFRKPKEPNLEGLDRAQFDWEANRTLPFAGDFLGAAYALGQGSRAKDAANFVRNVRTRASKAVVDLANKILDEEEQGSSSPAEPPILQPADRYKRISFLRNLLSRFPRHPLAYMDLAREYVALGQGRSAEKPVMLALALAPNNRFILRSASRFFLYLGNDPNYERDPKQAHDILRKAERVRVDPWILAAEIAVASAVGRTSRLIKVGRSLVNSNNLSPSHISELASALATVELAAGKVREGKRLFRRALEKPTENVLAQAGWLRRQMSDLSEINSINWEIPCAYEARAWANIIDKNWLESLKAAELWQRDEPFSKRAAVFGSWVALTLEGDFKKSEALARQGLIMHPKDLFLLNNLSVALAYMGRVSEAIQEFEKIDKEEANGEYKATYLATMGLIKFRDGSVEEGRRLYREAVDEAKKGNDIQIANWALLHFAREEAQHDRIKGKMLMAEALADFSKISKFGQTISSRLLEFVDRPSHLESGRA